VTVKICGLTNAEDVEAAVVAGASAVGFVRHPASTRYVDWARMAELSRSAGPFVVATSVHDACAERSDGRLIQQARVFTAGLDDPHVRRIQVVPVEEGSTLDDLLAAAQRSLPGVEAFLLDSSVGGRTGGTGHTMDWGLAAAFVDAWPGPVILAGGLTPDNVAEAVRLVKPYGVDVCSGVEASPGIKDKVKVQDFVAAARSA